MWLPSSAPRSSGSHREWPCLLGEYVVLDSFKAIVGVRLPGNVRIRLWYRLCFGVMLRKASADGHTYLFLLRVSSRHLWCHQAVSWVTSCAAWRRTRKLSQANCIVRINSSQLLFPYNTLDNRYGVIIIVHTRRSLRSITKHWFRTIKGLSLPGFFLRLQFLNILQRFQKLSLLIILMRLSNLNHLIGILFRWHSRWIV